MLFEPCVIRNARELCLAHIMANIIIRTILRCIFMSQLADTWNTPQKHGDIVTTAGLFYSGQKCSLLCEFELIYR